MIKREEMSEKEIRDWYVSRHGLDVNDDGTQDYYVHTEFLKAWDEKRLHGEWIYHKYDKDFECSMCHYRFDEDEFGLEIPQENGTWVKVCMYNFCPNCGSENRPKEGE